jgi:hypothetical protein
VHALERGTGNSEGAGAGPLSPTMRTTPRRNLADATYIETASRFSSLCRDRAVCMIARDPAP